MSDYTRRKLLRDLGIVSASTAGIGIAGCRLSTPQEDLYVMLQGPWLLSLADESYLRVVTAKLPCHVYSYFDPHPQPWPDIPADNAIDNRPILQASSATDLTLGQRFDFKVDRGWGGETCWPREKRSHLFDAMRDQSQGLFYSSEVILPEAPNCNLRALDIHLSYPDAVFAMDVQHKFTFSDLDYVVDKQVKKWPSTIVLRYRNWTSAAFSGDGIRSQTVEVGTFQVHRKFAISYSPPLPQSAITSPQQVPAAASKATPCSSDQTTMRTCSQFLAVNDPIESELDASWAGAMKLLKFKYEKIPRPSLAKIKHGSETDRPKLPSDSAISQDELDCLPPLPPILVSDAKLVASTAGSVGVYTG
jgi:hypothetical protein